MSKVLQENFAHVESADAHPYGYSNIRDFINEPYARKSFDWVITNPPFKLAEEFVAEGLRVARVGIAILARTVFLESVGRYDRLFRDNPVDVFAQFVERVPMVKARLDPKATTATGYAWFVWANDKVERPRLCWIPPCRRELECDGDYESARPPGDIDLFSSRA